MSETQTTLRETLAAELEKVQPEPVVETVQEPVVTETPEQKADRLRDEKGRFAPGTVDPKPAVAKAPVVEAKARPPRPSTWKKEMWDRWEKIDPIDAEYIVQREQEFAKGVSTYKTEWDQAKPLVDAMAPFQSTLQQHGIKPEQWITNLGNAHRALSLGSPQEKLQMFQKLAQDYQVPLQQLFVRGEDGQVYFNQQQQTQKQPDVRQTVMELLAERDVQQEVSQVQNDKENFPHFEQVRGTMAGLLQSGLAENLKAAYEAAVRLPKHSDIFDAMQKQQREKEEADRLEKERTKVSKARANAISPKTSTPSSPGNSSGKKGLRDQISDTFDEVVGGRV
jgi:hypothetical protein